MGDLILTEVLQGFRSDKDCETQKLTSVNFHFAKWVDTMLPFKVPKITDSFEKPGFP